MQFTNYWQQFTHTGRVEDYLNYLQNAEKESEPAVTESSCGENCMVKGKTEPFAGEDGSCRNPCM